MRKTGKDGQAGIRRCGSHGRHRLFRRAEIFGTDATELLDSPVVLLGTLDEIEERLLARRERWGFSYYVFSGPVADEMAPVVARLTGR